MIGDAPLPDASHTLALPAQELSNTLDDYWKNS